MWLKLSPDRLKALGSIPKGEVQLEGTWGFQNTQKIVDTEPESSPRETQSWQVSLVGQASRFMNTAWD